MYKYVFQFNFECIYMGPHHTLSVDKTKPKCGHYSTEKSLPIYSKNLDYLMDLFRKVFYENYP